MMLPPENYFSGDLIVLEPCVSIMGLPRLRAIQMEKY